MSRSQKISAKIKSLIQKEKEDQSPESKLPWILAISSSLKENVTVETVKKTIAFDDDDMDDRKYQEPREPETPRPTITKGMMKQQVPAKKIAFHAYRASHPELLESMNSIIEKGLEELTKLFPPNELIQEEIAQDERKESSQQQLAIKTNKKASEKIEKQYELYSYVFQRFINESTIYQKVLRDVRNSYEDYITDLITQMTSYEEHNLSKSEQDASYSEKLNSIEKQYKEELLKKEQLIADQQNTISSMQKQLEKFKDDTKCQRDQYQVMKKEYDDLKASCHTLTAGLTRLEDDNRLYQTNETNRLVEMSLMKMSEQKLNEEIERLQHIIQSLEQLQTNMVSQDTVTQLEGTMNGMKEEMTRLEMIHRQLLLRYTTLKYIIDLAFGKWEYSNGSSDIAGQGPSGTLPRSPRRQQSFVNGAMKATSFDKINKMLDISTSLLSSDSLANANAPQYLFETMLDLLLGTTGLNVHGSNGSNGNGNGGALRFMSTSIQQQLIESIEKELSQSITTPGNPTHNNAQGGNTTNASTTSHPTNPLLPTTTTTSVSYEASQLVPVNTVPVPSNTTTTTVTNPVTIPVGYQLAEEFKSPWTHFDGLGYHESIPIFLRFHGKVQNFQYSKHDVMKLIQELWIAKDLFDSITSSSTFLTGAPMANAITAVPTFNPEIQTRTVSFDDVAPTSAPGTVTSRQPSRQYSHSGHRHQEVMMEECMLPSHPTVMVSEELLRAMPTNPSMSIFLHYYLLDKFPVNRIHALEVAYNLMDGMKRYTGLSDCRMFAAVLEERLPMAIYQDQQALITMLREEIYKEIKIIRSTSYASSHLPASTTTTNSNTTSTSASSSSSSESNMTGKMTSEQLLRLLRKLLPGKSDLSLGKLMKAVNVDNGHARAISLHSLFQEDVTQGKRSHFLEQLKLQHILETISYEKHIMDSIDQFNDPPEMTMTVSKLRDALTYADSQKARSEINFLLAKGCQCSIEDMLLLEAKRSAVINVQEFKKYLRYGLLQKNKGVGGGSGSAHGKR